MARNYQKLPRIALAGRRNVGKSTLLNALYGRRRAITDAYAGLTRDILEVEVQKPGYAFLLSDTPGLDIDNPGKLDADIVQRAFEYIQSVDLIIFLLEAPAPEPFDYDFIELFRKKNNTTPVLYVINKVDGVEQQAEGMAEFYKLGLSPLIAISARGRWNMDELLRHIGEMCPRAIDLSTKDEQNLPKKKGHHFKRHKNKFIEPIPEDAFLDEETASIPDISHPINDSDSDHDDDDFEDDYIVYDLESPSSDIEVDNQTDPGQAKRTHQSKAASHADDYDNNDDDDDLEEDSIDDEDGGVQTISSQYADKKDLSIIAGSSILSDSRIAHTRIALVGRPNAGKSSIFNKLISKDLAIVSDIPGTTRDTMDTVISYHGQKIRIVDTAGLRRKGKMSKSDSIEFYSAARTRRAIRDARVVIHIIDTLSGITDYDKKISQQIRELHRPVILAFNKWDAVENKHNHSIQDYMDKYTHFFPHIRQIPAVFCSAISGQRITNLLDLALDLDQKMKTRISTGVINQQVKTWLKKGPTSSRSLRVYYVSQVETEPPAFVFFVNKESLFRENLKSYMENKIRSFYKLEGIPIDLIIRERKKEASR